MRVFEIVVKICIFVISISLIVLAALSIGAIIYEKDGDQLKNSTCVIVLGSDSNDDEQMLQNRVETAVKLYEENYFEKIILSGGGEVRNTDAERMRRILLLNKFPIENIFLDKESQNLYENLKNSKEIAMRIGCERIIGISSSYNLARIKIFAKELGIKIFTYPAQNSSMSDEILPASKEIMKLMYNLVF